MDYTIILLVLLGIAAAVIILATNNKKKSSSADSRRTTTIVIEPVADPDPEPEPEIYEDPSRVITTILKYSGNKSIWVCPECEVENPASEDVCFLCHHVR